MLKNGYRVLLTLKGTGVSHSNAEGDFQLSRCSREQSRSPGPGKRGIKTEREAGPGATQGHPLLQAQTVAEWKTGRELQADTSAGCPSRRRTSTLGSLGGNDCKLFFFFLDSHVTSTLSRGLFVSYFKTFPNSRVCRDLHKHTSRGRNQKERGFLRAGCSVPPGSEHSSGAEPEGSWGPKRGAGSVGLGSFLSPDLQ